MFQDAVNALRAGNKALAKDVLTRLLKTDQNNATYWVWMSAAMETHKERVYCLQTALRFDPENIAAKRGLTLLGAIPPDENVQPFSLNHPRAWEEKLLLAHELAHGRLGRRHVAHTSSADARLRSLRRRLLLISRLLVLVRYVST